MWRNNTLGHSQEGDQVWAGTPLLQVFDPSEMEVELAVGEPDGAALVPGAKALVHLDAFPELSFTAHFDSASPVATSPLGTSLKTFSARFRLDQSDPHLLPDLSAALDIELAHVSVADVSSKKRSRVWIRAVLSSVAACGPPASHGGKCGATRDVLTCPPRRFARAIFWFWFAAGAN